MLPGCSAWLCGPSTPSLRAPPDGAGRVLETASTRKSRDQTAAIREWARKAGHAVSDRGRISSTVTATFQEAHRSLKAVGAYP